MADFSQQGIISITCPKRITPYLKKELTDLGFPIEKERLAGVETKGSLNDCMLLNLSLRTAHRVHFRLKDCRPKDADQLYKELIKIPWEDYIDKHGYVSVQSFIKNKTVTNTQFANLKVKDAIVDRIRKKTGSRPDSGPNLNKTVVFIFWKNDRAQIYLDTSGESISRRGYRTESHTAPMQETLAAALIMASKWKPGQHFINPMCGTGTIAIEAALQALNKAPGLLRPNYGIKHILGFDEERWSDLRSDLKNKANKDFEGRIIATDYDVRAVNATRKNARTAGLDHLIETRKCDFSETNIPEGDPGVIMLNPPYGDRIGNEKELEPLYEGIGDYFKQEATGWWGYVFTGNFDLAKKIGLRTNQRIEFYNSTIDARLLEYELY
ncbi:THUMP domain-containing class I SAM-dependent RNA methyltransferase [Gracilimonas mengyeensis]|uniref:Putative N6-adenine-specific DNA methylase n=1 Tax=Gracilimonas mengyeensis TaxID=1302730 RepID=A0A521AVB6_9BACT|nr:class I SAM-dependent RNA methyltransferase [Gracilimonas mengyeensis]SMO38757.1 putative N6-adenine-specific DNA methylase [Gracilimonas mengyeensis]